MKCHFKNFKNSLNFKNQEAEVEAPYEEIWR